MSSFLIPAFADIPSLNTCLNKRPFVPFGSLINQLGDCPQSSSTAASIVGTTISFL